MAVARLRFTLARRSAVRVIEEGWSVTAAARPRTRAAVDVDDGADPDRWDGDGIEANVRPGPGAPQAFRPSILVERAVSIHPGDGVRQPVEAASRLDARSVIAHMCPPSRSMTSERSEPEKETGEPSQEQRSYEHPRPLVAGPGDGPVIGSVAWVPEWAPWRNPGPPCGLVGKSSSMFLATPESRLRTRGEGVDRWINQPQSRRSGNSSL
jgi:hypothetical protein